MQRTNCHPFREGQWLWMHNGAIREFQKVKRDLVLAVDPSLFTPTSRLQRLRDPILPWRLTLGLTDDPFGAVARAIGLVEKVGHEHGIEHPFQGTVATSNGESIWAFRYSSERPEPVPVLLHRGRRSPRAAPRSRDARQAGPRDSAGGVRAAWRPTGAWNEHLVLGRRRSARQRRAPGVLAHRSLTEHLRRPT